MMVNESRVYDGYFQFFQPSISRGGEVKSDLLKSQSQYVIFFQPSVNQNLTPHYPNPCFVFLPFPIL